MMAVLDNLHRASRDVIGGGFAGLLAGWALGDVNLVATTVLGLLLIVLLVAFYWVMDRIAQREDTNLTDEEVDEWIDEWPNQAS
jgi:uncharacterized membrane protein (Fun14 family)